MTAKWMLAVCLIAAGLVGCGDKPSLFPNSDPKLMKSKTEFAEEAKKLFPYPGPATEEVIGAAQIDVEYDKIRLTNFSTEEWRNIDLWVNGSYVMRVPKVEAKEGIRTLDYQMIYNAKGEHLPTNNEKYRVEKVEIRKNGVMCKVPVKLAY
jgi:hypothetical protein